MAYVVGGKATIIIGSGPTAKTMVVENLEVVVDGPAKVPARRARKVKQLHRKAEAIGDACCAKLAEIQERWKP